MQFASSRVQRPVELRWQDRSFSWPRPAPKSDLGAEAKKVRFWSLLRGGILKGKWRAKRSFRPRRSSKTESWRCENKAFVDSPQKLKVEDVKRKLSCETSLKNWKLKMWKQSFRGLPSKTESWRCEEEAFVRDFPKKQKVEDVKTKLSFETSL